MNTFEIPAPALPAPFARGLSAGKNIFVISSDEALLAQEAADALRLAARQLGFSERQWFMVSGAHFKWGEVLASGNALSLFADKQILELRIPQVMAIRLAMSCFIWLVLPLNFHDFLNSSLT